MTQNQLTQDFTYEYQIDLPPGSGKIFHHKLNPSYAYTFQQQVSRATAPEIFDRTFAVKVSMSELAIVDNRLGGSGAYLFFGPWRGSLCGLFVQTVSQQEGLNGAICAPPTADSPAFRTLVTSLVAGLSG